MKARLVLFSSRFEDAAHSLTNTRSVIIVIGFSSLWYSVKNNSTSSYSVLLVRPKSNDQCCADWTKVLPHDNSIKNEMTTAKRVREAESSLRKKTTNPGNVRKGKSREGEEHDQAASDRTYLLGLSLNHSRRTIEGKENDIYERKKTRATNMLLPLAQRETPAEPTLTYHKLLLKSQQWTE